MSEPLIETLGRYKILKVLGAGAMGVVYQAIDPMIDRVVAIKTVNLRLSREDMRDYEARFTQEIKAAGKLHHPNIVTIYDVGKTDDMAYMAMEYIDGFELKTLLREERELSVEACLEMMAQVADGLAFAHKSDIVHRDVKPANIMVEETDDGLVAKIMDFGIARVPVSSVKTQTGMILGSPRYMSPEQVIGKDLDLRTDIFSLGVVLYEVLTHAAPFDGPSVNSIMYATVNTPSAPPSVINPAIPSFVDAIVHKALAKVPAERFQTMREFSKALREAKRRMESGDAGAVAPAPLAPRATVGAAATSTRSTPAAPPAQPSQPAPQPAPPPVAPAAGQSAATPAPARAAQPPQPGVVTTGTRKREIAREFDSTQGTLRLAAFTQQPEGFAEFVKPKTPAPAAPPAARAPAPPPPAAPKPEPPKPTARAPQAPPAPKPAARPQRVEPTIDADAPQAITFSSDDAHEIAPRKIPLGPALLLGSLSAIAAVLAIGLAI